ncbi:general stress protein [Paenibacillus sp. UNC451MF]|uniref:general stress protein n=1 Tax=Paenibacillus sp. UNC451MF TaxID=1449063 RepID=UPI00048D7E95|nr:general stress protein [Paenibacillus sp. UNC451MF]
MDNKVKLVMTEEQAIEAIRSFRREGYALEEIYVLAHDDKTTEGLTDLMDTNKVGLYEEGIANTFANLFRSRGDQLRSKMHSLGLTKDEADHFEAELDKGKILVMVWYDDIDRHDLEDARRRNLQREEPVVPPAGLYLSDTMGPDGTLR